VQTAATNGSRSAPWALDVPYILALAFWAACLELVLNRGMGVVISRLPSGGTLSLVFAAVAGVGIFLGYFSSLLALVLAIYTLWMLMARPGLLAWWRKASTAFFGIIVILSVAVLLVYPALPGGADPDRVVSLIVVAQCSITALAFLLGLSALAVPAGPVKKIFAVFPVLVLLVVGVHQYFYFFPLAMPPWMPSSLPDVMLMVGQALAIFFPFPVAGYVSYQHIRHGLPVFIHVLVAISGFFPCLVLANMPAALYRDLFYSMLGMKLALPAPGILYPLAILPLIFIFSALVGTPVASRDFMISRRRAGFGLGLVYLGTFTPLSAPQAAFLVLGVMLWMKSIVFD